MYLIFPNIEQFNEWHESVKAFFGIPSDDGLTTDYSIPYAHPDDGKVAAPITDDLPDELYAGTTWSGSLSSWLGLPEDL